MIWHPTTKEVQTLYLGEEPVAKVWDRFWQAQPAWCTIFAPHKDWTGAPDVDSAKASAEQAVRGWLVRAGLADR